MESGRGPKRAWEAAQCPGLRGEVESEAMEGVSAAECQGELPYAASWSFRNDVPGWWQSLFQ